MWVKHKLLQIRNKWYLYCFTSWAEKAEIGFLVRQADRVLNFSREESAISSLTKWNYCNLLEDPSLIEQASYYSFQPWLQFSVQ